MNLARRPPSPHDLLTGVTTGARAARAMARVLTVLGADVLRGLVTGLAPTQALPAPGAAARVRTPRSAQAPLRAT